MKNSPFAFLQQVRGFSLYCFVCLLVLVTFTSRGCRFLGDDHEAEENLVSNSGGRGRSSSFYHK